MKCLYFTSDLMFTSRVKPVAVAAGVELVFPGFEAIDFDDKPDLIFFDLEFVNNADLSDLMSKFQKKWPEMPRTVAYAPHVKEARLQNARDCGVEKVVTRGQFNNGFASFFESDSPK